MGLSTELLIEALDLLEEHEARFLVWGDTNGFFTEQDVLDVLAPTLGSKVDLYELFFQLLQFGYLFQVPNLMGLEGYRTRMAESVNLFRNQRQWFLNQKLESTRSLVADYRFLRRRRRYPKRDCDSHQLLIEWQPNLLQQPLRQAAADALLQGFSLANFQAKATVRILQAWQRHSQPRRTPSGTIVCAGTGSGKTLSFYLPALTALAAEIEQQRTSRVRILAIYPRKELLKDQFNETWLQCRKLDDVLLPAAGRKIRIAALFGDTPDTLTDVSEQSNSGNYHFSLLQCPKDGCDGKMVWHAENQVNHNEQLQCQKCGKRTGNDEISITRQSILTNIPDILFTTTEMLNQHLGNRRYQKLFGIGKDVIGPTLVLLDEVHTYTGNTGAQTAYLLRRWMQRAYCRPHYVGLSATLADAETVFSELIGAQTKHVRLIEPNEDEMIEEGAEYLMVLRGDPVSQTSLLSTTIQTTSLTRRILDNKKRISDGVWGNKTFVFTDNLDLVNRLFHDLADAEGWNTTGKLTPQKAPLASLRDTQGDASKIQRFTQFGQNWAMPQSIGHSLSEDDRALIDRTSSQDSGVNKNAEIVVATSSLEVGFNDPEVGAVIQHKAPRDVASYLQRKGRAGRIRKMRPWMLAVMSDFGRDRMAFQQYETLIDPEVKRQNLPLGNSHIQKMQAAMATLDWLGYQNDAKSLWNLLNYPMDKKGDNKKELQRTQLVEQIHQLLTDDAQLQKLSNYLSSALGLNDSSLQRVLWHPPRSVVMEFLPSLKRQVETNWTENGETWSGLTRDRSPVPEFIPGALFDELNQPNLSIELQRGKYPKWEGLNFFQGLREFAPGRISKRYAVRSRYDADWLVPDNFVPQPDICQSVEFGVEEAFGNGVIHSEAEIETKSGSLSVYRPTALRTRTLSFETGLTEKSNAQLHWKVRFTHDTPGLCFTPPSGPWSNYLKQIQFFTHQQLTPLEITRYCTGSTASMRFRNGAKGHAHFRWTKEGKAVAIGDTQWFDGLCLRFEVDEQQLLGFLDSATLQRSLKGMFFSSKLRQLPVFEFDPFSANWICECYLSAIALGLVRGKTMDQVMGMLTSSKASEYLIEVSDSLFQSGLELDEKQPEKLQSWMRELFSQPSLMADLTSCLDCLCSPLSLQPNILIWLKSLLSNTIAAAVQKWLLTVLPDIDERALVIDSQWHNQQLQIWVSESEPGGSGIISRLAENYHQDPVQLLNMWIRCTSSGDYEQLDGDLYQLLQLLPQQPTLADCLTRIRASNDYKSRFVANKQLRQQLRMHGFNVSHSFMAVLFSRILRPGSSQRNDENILLWLTEWCELEETAGLELNLNAVCHAFAKHRHGDNVQQVFSDYCRLQGQLWPRGNIIRQSELSHYNQFIQTNSGTERLLLEQMFQNDVVSTSIEQLDWLSELQFLIGLHGNAELRIPRSSISKLNEVITTVNVEPINYHGLFLHPRLGGLRRESGDLMACFELAEALH
ncbi:DEAD/DEAH box helicase [Shewanella sp. FJAT-51649]|uniref:protein DpdJ n=1 Tax=Shewanella sp. FJAT-51649 TaxID=2864210 RepID=UPI001C65E350|nr:protein DpdJ [Shewanella sp. FJAT-51649]QYJ70314.1 DEAD/DEAH box helicase [Shewanella sp. FJAT-51649]